MEFYSCYQIERSHLVKRNEAGEVIWIVDLDNPEWHLQVKEYEEKRDHREVKNMIGLTVEKEANMSAGYIKEDGYIIPALHKVSVVKGMTAKQVKEYFSAVPDCCSIEDISDCKDDGSTTMVFKEDRAQYKIVNR